MKSLAKVLILFAALFACLPAYAHHILGRPSYNLNGDSNTPPSMEIETQIGNYTIRFLAYPAFPEPMKWGRVHFYARRIDNGKPFDGKVTFTVRDDSWFTKHQEVLGTQGPLDHVYLQGFRFSKAGYYIISANFTSDNQPYVVDFPIRIGKPLPLGPIGLTVVVVVVVLVGVNMLQRKGVKRFLRRLRQRTASS